jgi:hypothetical protein
LLKLARLLLSDAKELLYDAISLLYDAKALDAAAKVTAFSNNTSECSSLSECGMDDMQQHTHSGLVCVCC